MVESKLLDFSLSSSSYLLFRSRLNSTSLKTKQPTRLAPFGRLRVVERHAEGLQKKLGLSVGSGCRLDGDVATGDHLGGVHLK